MTRLWLGFIRVQATIVVFLLLGIILIVLANTVTRAAGFGSITWVDESARMAFVIFSFLAAALACSFGAHLVVDGIVEKAGGWLRRALGALQALLSLAFFVALIFGGAIAALANQSQRSPAIAFPVGALYLTVAVSGFLMIFNTYFAYKLGPVSVQDGRIVFGDSNSQKEVA